VPEIFSRIGIVVLGLCPVALSAFAMFMWPPGPPRSKRAGRWPQQLPYPYTRPQGCWGHSQQEAASRFPARNL